MEINGLKGMLQMVDLMEKKVELLVKLNPKLHVQCPLEYLLSDLLYCSVFMFCFKRYFVWIFLFYSFLHYVINLKNI